MGKRVSGGVLALLCLLCCIHAGAVPLSPVATSAKAFVVYDPWLEETVLGENADLPLGMASTTKIMTAALALELYDPAAQVTIRPQWCGVEGSSMYLTAGETLTVADLIYGLMLMSGNDAALALASLLTGDPADFVARMNQKAALLGLENIAFQNPSGLSDESHYATARDMAVLTAWALENPDFAAIAATKSTTRAGRYMKNHNKLLSTLEGCVGGKTGYTKATGRCLVSACTRQGRTFIVVTLGCPDDWRDHAALYDHAFSGMARRQLSEAGSVGWAYLAGGGQVELTVARGMEAVLSEAEAGAVTAVLCGPRIWYGQAEKGGRWGTLEVRLSGRAIDAVPVHFAGDAAQALPRPGLLARLWQVIQRIFGG